MNVLVIPVEYDVGRPKECVAENRELVLISTQNTLGAARDVRDEVVVADFDGDSVGPVAKDKLHSAALTGVEAVNSVQIGRGHINGRGERGDEVVEDGSRKSAEGVSAVEQDGLTNTTRRLSVDVDDGPAGLANRDTGEADIPPGETVGGLRRRDDRELDERTRILVGIDAAKDDGPDIAVKAAQVHAEGTAVGGPLGRKTVDHIRIRGSPTEEIRASTHNAYHGVCGAVSGTEDLLWYSGAANADDVAHVLEVGVSGVVRDGALNPIVDQGS